MQVRLAFSVAAHLEPEVLIVDEVLAVGDAEFQAKCIGKMKNVTAGGDRTVLFVSHNMASIRSLCTRCVLLDEGRIVAVGDTADVVRKYLSLGATEGRELTWNPESAPGSAELRFQSVKVLNAGGDPMSSLSTGNDLFVEIRYNIFTEIANLRIALTLYTDDGVVVLATSDYHHQGERRLREPGQYSSVCRIPAGLLNVGRYVVSIDADIPKISALVTDVRINLELEELAANHLGVILSNRPPGVIHPRLDWRVSREAVTSS